MTEAICPECIYKVEGPNKEELVDKVTAHLMEKHLGFLRGDVLEHKFVKCPVCNGEVNKPLRKCPNCGADLVKQRAILLANMYAK